MAQTDYSAVLTGLRATESLSIYSLAEPIIISAQQQQQQQSRDPNDSNTNSEIENPTPASLAQDLIHYQELFKKLRFSYLEQVTKEKYLRSIVGDPPVLVSHADNAKLEDELAGTKTELKARKQAVEQLVQEMDAMAASLAGRQRAIEHDTHLVETLPAQIEEMARRVREMLERQQGQGQGGRQGELDDEDPRMKLPLEATQALVAEQQQKVRDVERQIAALQRQMPSKMRECEAAERDLNALERRKNDAVQLAKEATRLREEGGRDVLEEQGRWYRSADVVMRGLGLVSAEVV